MRKLSSLVRITGLVIFCLSIANYAFAGSVQLKSVKVATFRVKPTLNYSVAYTSNVGLVGNTTNSSDRDKYRMVTTVRPGLAIQVPLQRAFIETAYELGFFKANGLKEQFTHTGRGLLSYNISDTAAFAVEDVYTLAPRNFAGGKKYSLNTLTGTLSKQFGARLGSGFKYTYQTYDTSEDVFGDFNDHGTDLNFNYRLNPLTTLGLDLDWNKRAFSTSDDAGKNKDYNAWTSSFSIGRQLFPRLSVSSNVGYAFRRYRKGENRDVGAVTYGGGLAARLTNFSNLNIDYAHTLTDTFYALNLDPAHSDSQFALNEGLASLVRSDYRYVDTDRVVANLNYRPTDKDTFNVGFAYLWSKSSSTNALSGPSTQNLDEESYTIGAGYSRNLTRWFALGFSGAYGSKTSNIGDSFDYKSFGGLLNINISY